MENIIIATILITVVGGAIFYIWKEKKKGRKCIGCPSCTSSGACNCRK